MHAGSVLHVKNKVAHSLHVHENVPSENSRAWLACHDTLLAYMHDHKLRAKKTKIVVKTRQDKTRQGNKTEILVKLTPFSHVPTAAIPGKEEILQSRNPCLTPPYTAVNPPLH